MDMLVLADSDGVVDMTHEAIARVTNVPLDWVKRSIHVLESPDPKSRTPDNSGARIARLDEHREWGWVILNYDRFREIATEEQRRVRTRERVRRHREKRTISIEKPKCNADVTLCNADVTPLYASVSVSTSGKGVQGKGERNLVPQLKAEVGKHYGRGPDDRWGCDEEYALVEVAKRPAALEEFDTIRAYYRNGAEYPRTQVKTLLENWPGELDKARNHKPKEKSCF